MKVNLKSNRSLFIVGIPPIVIACLFLLAPDETTVATVVYIVVPIAGAIGAIGLFVLIWMNRRTPFKDIGAGALRIHVDRDIRMDYLGSVFSDNR